jgi:hypothetical protein
MMMAMTQAKTGRSRKKLDSITLLRQSFLSPPPLAEDPERFDRTCNISLPLPWREGKKGRGIRSVGVTPHLTSPRSRGEDLLYSCGGASLEKAS